MSGIINSLFASFAKGFLKLGSVTVNNGGQYSGTPDVGFTGGGGTGAAATAVMGTVTNPGSVIDIVGNAGYYSVDSAAPLVGISGGGGSGATAVANLGTGQVLFVYSSDARTTQQTGDFIFSGGGGTGAAGKYFGGPARITYTINSFFISDGGSGYTSPPTVVFTPWAGTTAITLPTATANISDGKVVSVTLNSGGEMITDPQNDLSYGFPAVSLSGGGGSGAYIFPLYNLTSVIDYWVTGGFFSSPQITNPGSGYTSAPTATVPGQISGTVNVIVGKYAETITVTNGGTGYTSNPAVTLSGGTNVIPGLNQFSQWFSYIDATSYNVVNSVSVTNAGTGYTSTPSISFSGGGPTVNATATANMIPE